MKRALWLLPLLALAAGVAWQQVSAPLPEYWSDSEVALIGSLSLTALPPLPADPSNAVADSEEAARLGRWLYFDPRLSANGRVACASCHQPALAFTDGLALAVGIDVGTRHTPSLIGLSYSPWYYWDGRKDSQWAQALAPLEAPIEHGSDRLSLLRLLVDDSHYSRLYRATFGDLPPLADIASEGTAAVRERGRTAAQQHQIDAAFANMGKALAAYQRKLQPGRSRFDDYADGVARDGRTGQGELLSSDEIAGLGLFIGKAQCINCHNGPLFTNFDFHNTGVLAVSGQLPAIGRYDGIRLAREDPFNCLGPFSDARESDCVELRFARDDNQLVGAHKTPTLRNITETAPYMHGGQIATLTEVVRHYNEAPVSMLSHNEAKPLNLRPVERRQLEAFLATLSAPLAAESEWLEAPNYAE